MLLLGFDIAVLHLHQLRIQLWADRAAPIDQNLGSWQRETVCLRHWDKFSFVLNFGPQFWMKMDKKLSASGGLRLPNPYQRLCPWTMLQDLPQTSF